MPVTIAITPTDTTLELEGVPVRLWEGTTQGGVACKVFVHRVAPREAADLARFAAELEQLAAPAPDGPDGPSASGLGWTRTSLAKLVRGMRKAQRTFYRRRRVAKGDEHHALLTAALELERKVDRVLDEIDGELPLFDTPAGGEGGAR